MSHFFSHFYFETNSNLSCPIKKREKVDNTAAEAQAAEKSIEIAAQRSINKLIIVTDSQTLVNFDKNCFKWEKEGWEDKDLYALNQIKKRCSNIDVDFEYVEAHSRNKYNDEAHKLAKKGAILYAQQCAILYAEQFYTMKL